MSGFEWFLSLSALIGAVGLVAAEERGQRMWMMFNLLAVLLLGMALVWLALWAGWYR